MLLWVAAALNAWWILEQPKNSLMEELPAFQCFMAKIKTYRFHLKMSEYGGPTEKPTWLYSGYLAHSIRLVHHDDAPYNLFCGCYGNFPYCLCIPKYQGSSPIPIINYLERRGTPYHSIPALGLQLPSKERRKSRTLESTNRRHTSYPNMNPKRWCRPTLTLRAVLELRVGEISKHHNPTQDGSLLKSCRVLNCALNANFPLGLVPQKRPPVKTLLFGDLWGPFLVNQPKWKFTSF